RPARVPVPDPLHHAGDLSLSGQSQRVDGPARLPSRQGREGEAETAAPARAQAADRGCRISISPAVQGNGLANPEGKAMFGTPAMTTRTAIRLVWTGARCGEGKRHGHADAFCCGSGP